MFQQHDLNENAYENEMNGLIDQTYPNLTMEASKAKTLRTDKNDLWTRTTRSISKLAAKACSPQLRNAAIWVLQQSKEATI